MSIYTYESARLFCEALGLEFHESPAVSDQELDRIPEDAIIEPNKTYCNLGTIAAAEVNTGKKRPEHSRLMKQYYKEGKISPPSAGRYKHGHKRTNEILKKIGANSGAARLGQKRGAYKIVNRKIETCKCGRTISGAVNIRKHNEHCKQN